MHLAPTCIDPIGQKCKFFEIHITTAAMLYLQKCQKFPDRCSNSQNISTAFTLFETQMQMQIFQIQDGSDRWAEFNRCPLAQEVC